MGKELLQRERGGCRHAHTGICPRTAEPLAPWPLGRIVHVSELLRQGRSPLVSLLAIETLRVGLRERTVITARDARLCAPLIAAEKDFRT